MQDMEDLKRERIAQHPEPLQEIDGMRIMGTAIGNQVGRELQDLLNPMISSIGNPVPGYLSISSHPLKQQFPWKPVSTGTI